MKLVQWNESLIEIGSKYQIEFFGVFGLVVDIGRTVAKAIWDYDSFHGLMKNIESLHYLHICRYKVKIKHA